MEMVMLNKEYGMPGRSALATAVALMAFAGFTTALSAQGNASSFRLEVGPAVAGGATTKMKNVVLVVRPQVCEDPSNVRITGTAEGQVNGARQSVGLKLVPVDATRGIYAVQQQWSDDGKWVVQLNGSCSQPKASASTIVPVTKTGFIREKTQVLTETATKTQVDAALAALP